ncbi:hypothetical protein GGI15_002209 [Coemansia interrupta]|uniref:Uncharacterized protein n=1 Tax=Coemansia interrupta TaxID=1126814 RepID=A0A9W8HMR6_9FUNG|nr:hypothetical protein GGI15_002209 [Coemansia interrupta]
MGVKNLTSLLARFAPSCITTLSPKDIRGWSVGIDTNIFIHRFFRGNPLQGDTYDKRHLHGIYRMGTFMRSLDITPVFVFDCHELTAGKELETSRRTAAKMIIEMELAKETQRVARIDILESICARHLEDRVINTDNVDNPVQNKAPNPDMGSVFSWPLPLKWNQPLSKMHGDGRMSTMHAGNHVQQPDAVEWLQKLGEELAEKIRQRGSKITIEGRLNKLELTVCRSLLVQMGVIRINEESDSEHAVADARSALRILQKYHSERLATLERRAEPLTDKHIEECQMLVDAMGFAIHSVSSNTESEAMCAALDSAGVVDATCSEDLDVLPFGGRRLLRNFASLDSAASPMVLIDSAQALGELGLSRASFIDLCILCGTDFSSTLEGVGPITALKLIQQHGSIEAILAMGKYHPKEPESFNYELSRLLFTNDVKVPYASRDEIRAGPEHQADLDALLPNRGGGFGKSSQDCRDPFAQTILL